MELEKYKKSVNRSIIKVGRLAVGFAKVSRLRVQGERTSSSKEAIHTIARASTRLEALADAGVKYSPSVVTLPGEFAHWTKRGEGPKIIQLKYRQSKVGYPFMTAVLLKADGENKRTEAEFRRNPFFGTASYALTEYDPATGQTIINTFHTDEPDTGISISEVIYGINEMADFLETMQGEPPIMY